jgi:hypothetical protein
MLLISASRRRNKMHSMAAAKHRTQDTGTTVRWLKGDAGPELLQQPQLNICSRNVGLTALLWQALLLLMLPQRVTHLMLLTVVAHS